MAGLWNFVKNRQGGCRIVGIMIDPKREGAYGRIYAQLEGLIQGKSPDLTAAMAMVCAVLHHKLKNHFWTGFYFVASEDELHVGPYQGAVACQVLKGRDVCLHAARTRASVVVPDVEAFPGHIACDSRSKSEIAVPLVSGGRVVAVLDVDSDRAAQFDDDDARALERILGLLEPWRENYSLQPFHGELHREGRPCAGLGLEGDDPLVQLGYMLADGKA